MEQRKLSSPDQHRAVNAEAVCAYRRSVHAVLSLLYALDVSVNFSLTKRIVFFFLLCLDSWQQFLPSSVNEFSAIFFLPLLLLRRLIHESELFFFFQNIPLSFPTLDSDVSSHCFSSTGKRFGEQKASVHKPVMVFE